MIKWFEKNYILPWICVLLIAIFIFYISSLQFAPSLPGAQDLNAILYHMGVFFLFAGILSVALIKGKEKKFLIISFLIALGYGVSDEIHQYFVPGRHASFGDIFLDLVGIVFAILIYWIILEFRENKKQLQNPDNQTLINSRP